MEITGDYAVQMRGITKMFGDFYALKDVKLDVKKGKIHSLLGENGAGKSTLMNVLYGLYQAEQGQIYINGEKKEIKTPNDAIENGIGMVHQHFMLVDTFTVEQNIILGNEPSKNLVMIDKKRAHKQINEMLDKYKLNVDLDAKISEISVGMQQRVEILKALYRGVDILILDEPTAVLTPQEIEELKHIMVNLTKHGKTIIIITHKLKEIKDSAQECTIIRRGEYVDTVDVSKTNENELATKMVGRPVKLVVDKSEADPKEVIFEVNGITVKDTRGIEKVKNLSLNVKKGEILGIAGIDGNGQKELIEAITGQANCETGTIKINGQSIENTDPKTVLNSGISTIYEDRQLSGLVLPFTVSQNMVLQSFNNKPFQSHGILNEKEIDEYTDKKIEQYDIRPKDCKNHLARELSGGNQQKVIIAREISNDPDMLIAVQPTRGLDVGAIEYVHKEIIKQRDQGKAVLLVSYELDEVMNLSDTISVIYDGRIVKSFKQGETDEKTIGLLMAGGGKE